MILDIWTQLIYFSSTILSGFLVGIMYDTYRIIKGTGRSKKVLIAISDILFWILQALVVFLFLMLTNNGDLRYYTFIGILLGLFTYFKLLTRIIQTILIRILLLISKLFSIIKNIVLLPIKLITYIFSYILASLKIINVNLHKKQVKDKKKVYNENKKDRKYFKKNKGIKSLFKMKGK